MSNTNVTLNEVIKFNSEIKEFSKNLKQCFDQTNNALSKLSKKWQDHQFQTFKSNFKKHADKLQPLSQELDKYEKHIDTYWKPRIEQIMKTYKK